MNQSMKIAVVIAVLGLSPEAGFSAVQCCTEPFCGPDQPFGKTSNPPTSALGLATDHQALLGDRKLFTDCDHSNKAVPSAIVFDPMGIRDAYQRISRSRRSSKGAAIGSSPLPLVGELAGSWDFVDGYLTFPSEQFGVRLEILLRGFEANPLGSGDRYGTERWDRSLYWLDFNAGDAGEVPHLLPALAIASSYEPEAGDPIQQFVDDPAVQTECNGPDMCTVNFVPYTLLRESGRDYSSYVDGAAVANVFFVANNAGQAISMVAVIQGSDFSVERIDFLYEADELQLWTLAYDVSEPDFLYVAEYMDFATLTEDLFIERRHYIPGVDFVDPALPADFDAGAAPIQFLLEGELETQGGVVRAYGGPFDLGFSWENVPGFGFASGFEPLRTAVGVSSRGAKRIPLIQSDGH